ncbi:MAG: hypothetical protein VX738_11955, partial [Planctomycetota bacterium]|nr:hypothetical protein [Planctomycetota bacterium]
MENSTPPHDPRIQGLLQSLRSRIRIFVWLEGFSLAIIWVASMFWIGLAMDYLPILLGANELSPPARGILLGIVAVAFGYILYHWVFRRAFVKFSDRSMAILLERQFAGFNDSLVTSVTLKNQGASDINSPEDTYSTQMLSETIETALLSVDSVNVNQVFNKPLLLKRALLACLLLLSVGVFTVTNTAMANLAMRRLYLLDNEKWERAAHIQLVGISVVRDNFTSYDFHSPEKQPFVDGRVKVARGATLRLLINADGQKRIPDRCIFHYETKDGVSGRRRLLKEGGATGKDQFFVLADNPLDAIADSMEFEIIGHDHRIGPFYIDVVDSPEISQITLDYQYPAYTERFPVEKKDWIPGRTSLPFGTNLKLNLLANKPLQQLHMTDPSSAQYLATFTTVPDARTQKPIDVAIVLQSATPADTPELWEPSMLRGLENMEGVQVQFTLEQNELRLCDQSKNMLPEQGILNCVSSKQIPMIVQLNTVKSEFVFPVQNLQQDLMIHVSLYDHDGIISTEPFTVAISALADKPPNVEIGLNGIGTAITPDAIIPVTGSVSDDYGVDTSWFDIQLDEGDPLKFPIALAEGNTLQTPLDFRLERASNQRAELTPGEKVNLSVRANDKYDLQGDPNTGSSSQFTLDVVTPEELLAGLERRELALRQRFELILAEVQGMRDSLQLV